MATILRVQALLVKLTKEFVFFLQETFFTPASSVTYAQYCQNNKL